MRAEMTAQSAIRTPSQRRQSIEAMCKNERWQLLQKFARLEIALARSLGETAPITFGAKLRAKMKAEPAFKRFERLIAARNLLAHGLFATVDLDGELCVVWQVADAKDERNAMIRDEARTKQWMKEVGEQVDQALTAVAE